MTREQMIEMAQQFKGKEKTLLLELAKQLKTQAEVDADIQKIIDLKRQVKELKDTVRHRESRLKLAKIPATGSYETGI